MSNIAAYTNVRAVNEVLGAILQSPVLITQHQITQLDFADSFHRILFAAINNLYAQGATNIDGVAVDEYLSHYESQHRAFQAGGGVQYVDDVKEVAVLDNIKYYVDQLKKFSLLRRYKQNGLDVSDYFDPTEIEPSKIEEKRQKLDSESITDIINHYRRVMLRVTQPFVCSESRDSKKAGEGGLEQKERWKKSVAWGAGYSSAYLTTALHGMRPKMLTIRSAGTGVGKTRTALADLAYSCTPYYYDKKQDAWAKNPNGLNNGALYIGTEMELLEEIDPILWAYIADVPQDHIKYNAYGLGEEERVDRAIQILEKQSNIWLEYLPDFNIQALQNVIEEHVLEHHVKYVFFDYIHSTTSLISEFQHNAKAKIAIREDQVLLELSTKLKQLANDLGVCINTATQVNAGFKDENNRDQTIVAGSKAVINKADNAMIAMPPTTKELAQVEPILDAMGFPYRPNLVYTVYKVRDSQWKGIKIWLYIDYGTMRTHDMFVTNNEYELVPDIEKTFINVNAEDVASTLKTHAYVTEEEDLTLMTDDDW